MNYVGFKAFIMVINNLCIYRDLLLIYVDDAF